jgi:hypothetical protein
MHDEPNEQLGKWDVMERETVYLLTDPTRYPAIWSVPDIGRELDQHDPEALVRPLRNAGLLHQTADGFVFATPAAFRMVAMVGRII